MQVLTRALDAIAPHFKEHSGCIVRSMVATSAVDSWLISTDGNIPAVENVLNEVHFYEWLDVYGNEQLPELEALATRVAAVWRLRLSELYPDRVFTVTYATEPHEYGPTVSAHQADGCLACSGGGHSG